ncbi:MAG: hypothetical protein J6T41_03770 [Neisseriaceae bacterium]|nr:hypothetical protein [Neisseriaceae bacterium]
MRCHCKKTVSLRAVMKSRRGNPVNDAVINTKPQGFVTAYCKNIFRQPEWLNARLLKRLWRLFCLSAKLDCHA